MIQPLDIVAHLPHGFGLGLAGGDHRVGSDACFQHFAQHAFEQRAVAIGIVAAHLQQRIVRMTGGQRRVVAAGIDRQRLVEIGPHHFERGQAAAQPLAQRDEQVLHRAEAVQREHRRVGRLRRALQLQHGAGDDPQRAFGADEQVFQVIGGVVLDQGVERADHRAVGQHRLDPQHVVAHHAVTDHRIAAGIGRNPAADRRCAAPAPIDRKAQAVRFRRFLRRLHWDPGLDGHGPPHRIDRFDRTHPLERDLDVVRRAVRAVDQPGQPAGRDHALPGGVAQLHHRAQFCRAGGADHGPCLTGRQAQPVGRAHSHVFAGQQSLGANDGGDLVKQLAHAARLGKFGVRSSRDRRSRTARG